MTMSESINEGMFQMDSPANELISMLVKYDLTPNQAKVYLFLSKNGVKTASEISKSLKIPRTETYHLLSILQQKGIIFAVFGKPTKFNSVLIEESLDILINNEQNRVNELEIDKVNLVRLWKIIPAYGQNENESQDNKFQSLQGRNSILVKLEQMIKGSKENILVLGTSTDFEKFYYTGFANLLNKTKSDLRILTEKSTEKPYIFEDIVSKKIKKIEDKNREEFCFIIKDNSEVIFFISNSQVKNMLAMWTDSIAFVTTLKSLFTLMWKKSRHIDETSVESMLGSETTFEHRLKEIEQEKIILKYMQDNHKSLESRMEAK
jgi:sugar-specific transcriptional regulator TrmB